MFGTNARDHIYIVCSDIRCPHLHLFMKHLSLFQDSLKVDFHAIFSLKIDFHAIFSLKIYFHSIFSLTIDFRTIFSHFSSSYLSTVFSLQRLCAPLNLSHGLFCFLQGFAQRVCHASGFSQIYNSYEELSWNWSRIVTTILFDFEG